jgi:hypothetical protein
MSPADEDALRFFAQRAAYYNRTGKTTCGTCGLAPEERKVFTETMACGHPWTALIWTPNESVAEKEK